ncbi:MAG TPA: DUF4129 domain-containing protein [Gammaproteobacteria bacterium]|nr:DUF4129 domain-containing protein [Gammaproteobacteria bacterium]
MDLERIETVLRPRTPAESVDLGMLLARRWWPRLTAAWLLTALPALVLTHLLLWNHLVVAGVVLWWLKPLYEKAPLHFLGRAFFGDPPRLPAMTRHPGRFLGRELLADLTWGRLRPHRSFAAPVALLEGLHGRARRRRLDILERNQSTASWLTVVFAHFEAVLYLSLLVAAWSLVPEHLAPDLLSRLRQPSGALLAADNLLLFLVMGATAPFYVAGGFTLYLNRRVALEAWDTELAFRRIRRRLTTGSARIAAVLVLAAMVGLSGRHAPVLAAPAPGAALTERKAASRAIDEVLADDDFGQEETRTVWEPRFRSGNDAGGGHPDWLAALGRLLAMGGEGLLWLLAGAAVAALMVALGRRLRRVRPPRRQGGPDGAGPQVLFGLTVTPQSLPTDVAGAARALCRQGRTREALSLLYRASIARLIERFEVAIPAGATEGECLQRARSVLGDDGRRLFADLTGAWQELAYGHRAPEADCVEALCRDWAAAFGAGK